MQILLLLSFLLPSAPKGYIKSSDLKPGMKGYGLSVFRGTKPEKFKVEVISVIPNGLGMIKQNLILVRVKHKVTDHAGIIAGMSGSPIYINGKFAGGLGYGFSFQKDPIAMLTPAEAIVGTMKRPVKKQDPWGRRFAATYQSILKKGKASTAWSFAQRSPKSLVKPLMMSLSVGGLKTDIFKRAFPSLSQMGPVMPSGSSVNLGPIPKTYVPGGPVAVWMVAGDINVAAIGTVTHILGNKVSIFSHPFQAMGNTRMPTSRAYIHTVIARSSSSMKLGTMTKPLGALIKDEQATVVLDKSLSPGALPMTVSVTGMGEKKRVFTYKVAKNRFLTPRLVGALTRISLMKYYQNLTDLTYSISYDFKLKGRKKPISFSDSFSSNRGLYLGYGAYSVRGSLAINLLLNNPYKRVALEWVKVKAHIVKGLRQYRLVSAELPSPVLKVDKAFPIKLKLRPMVGKEVYKTISVKLPKNFKGTRVTFQLTSGRYTRVEDAQPKNLNQLISYIEKTMDSHNLVVTVKTPDPAVDIEGTRVKRIPLSVLDSLVRQNVGIMRKVQQTLHRKVIRVPEILNGRAIISAVVKHKENEAQ